MPVFPSKEFLKKTDEPEIFMLILAIYKYMALFGLLNHGFYPIFHTFYLFAFNTGGERMRTVILTKPKHKNHNLLVL